MSMTLDENTLAIWYYPIIDGSSDWLGVLNTKGNDYEFTYRHRYYEDDKAFDSKDKKSWYKGTLSGDSLTKDEVIEKLRKVCVMATEMLGTELTEVLMSSGGIDEFMETFKKLPFVNMQSVH